MAHPPKAPAQTAIRGWRARAWAWVLFLALFKGLVPHAALAAALMPGGPALLWCAPGKERVDDRSTGAQAPASSQHCVCASSGETTAPALNVTPLLPLASQERIVVLAPSPAARHAVWLPPVRGPPSA